MLITRRREAALSKQRIFDIDLNINEWSTGSSGANGSARVYESLAPVSTFGIGDDGRPDLTARHSPAKPTKRLLRRQQIILRRCFSAASATQESRHRESILRRRT